MLRRLTLSNVRVKSVKVRLNKEMIERLDKAKDRALDLTTQAILADITSRGAVPHDTGALERGSELYKSGYAEKVKECVYAIIYNTPYARRWYFNVDEANFKRDTSIDHWMDYYLDGEGIQWVKETYAKFFKQEAGGIIK